MTPLQMFQECVLFEEDIFESIIFWMLSLKIFKEETLTRFWPMTPLQIFQECVLFEEDIFESIINPKDTFWGYTEQKIGYHSYVNSLLMFENWKSSMNFQVSTIQL